MNKMSEIFGIDIFNLIYSMSIPENPCMQSVLSVFYRNTIFLSASSLTSTNINMVKVSSEEPP